MSTSDQGTAARWSVVIPARNEAKRLPHCVAALHAAAARARIQSPTIVVVNNRSTDATATVAAELGCTVVDSEARVLSVIRNVGVAVTTTPLVVTVDADSVVAPDFFVHLGHAVADPRVAGGGVLIFPERWSLGIAVTGAIIGVVALWYGISGGAFYFRRTAFDAIGGFDPNVLSAEDIDFARRLRHWARSHRQQFRTVWRTWIITSCRKFDSFGDWYFALRPWVIFRLLAGTSPQLADKVWYDYDEDVNQT